MKINSIQQNLNQSFRGSLTNSVANFITKHQVGIAGLAASSVVAQKLVMSSSEITLAPVVDVAVGKAITKVANEKDDRTIQSSKTQAIRTVSQSIGGTITGITIRMLAIMGCTALFMKAGEKTGNKLAKVINPEGISKNLESYKYAQKMSRWGKDVGGALAIAIMMVTNFLIDAPLINVINKKITEIFNPKNEANSEKNAQPEEKEAK